MACLATILDPPAAPKSWRATERLEAAVASVMSYNGNGGGNSRRGGGFGNRSRGRGGRGGGRGGGGRGFGGAQLGNEVCRNFMDGGKCNRQPCRFPHVFQKIGETRGHKGAVKDAAMWDARPQLFTAGADGAIKLWDCASWQEITTLRADDEDDARPNSGGDGGHREGVVALVLVGPFLFAGFDGAYPLNSKLAVGKVRAWNLENPQAPPYAFRVSDAMPFAHTMNVLSLACSTDARTGVATLFSGSADGSIRYWQLDPASNQFQCRGVLEGHIRGVTRLKTFVLGATPILASASVDSTIRLWDLTTYQCVTVLASTPATAGAPEQCGHTDAVMDLEFWVNQNETFLISGGLDSEIIVWSLAPPFAQLFRETQDSKVTALCGAQDTAQAPILLIGATDGSITVKELPSFAYKTTLRPSANQGHQDAVRRITTGPHNTFFSAGNDRRAIAWQITGDVASIQSQN